MMTKHDLIHKLTFAKYHVEQAVKALAPFYTHDAGVNTRVHLQEALAQLDAIDNAIYHIMLDNKGAKDEASNMGHVERGEHTGDRAGHH
jgi:hypothetical protein